MSPYSEEEEEEEEENFGGHYPTKTTG